jgi:biotin--protein ligase
VAVVDIDGVETVHGIYHNEGGEFISVESSQVAEILAKYVEGEGEGKIAAVRCRVGQGIAILWGTHLEYPLTQEPPLSALKKRDSPLSDDEMKASEQRRWKLLRKTIAALGLSLPSDSQESNKSAPSLLPQFLTSSIPSLPTRIMALLVAHTTSTESPSFRDGNDTFLLHPSSSATSILCQARDRAVDEANTQLPKEILFNEDGKLLPEELTPKFSMRQYYSHLHGADVHADSER